MGADQFVVVADGRVKLNDFNRGHFLGWNPEKQEVCPFKIKYNGGTHRSPEEYLYLPETEKVRIEIHPWESSKDYWILFLICVTHPVPTID